MARRKLKDTYAQAIAEEGPYDNVSMDVIAEIFLGGIEHSTRHILPHQFDKWEYPAIRDTPQECIESGPSLIRYETYVAIIGDGDLLYIVPNERKMYSKSRRIDWFDLKIMNSLRSLKNRYLRLFGGQWTVVVDLELHMLYGWHPEHGSIHLKQNGMLYFSGKGAKSLLATRLTWKSQSESYKDAVYGEKVALWTKGIRVA